MLTVKIKSCLLYAEDKQRDSKRDRVSYLSSSAIIPDHLCALLLLYISIVSTERERERERKREIYRISLGMLSMLFGSVIRLNIFCVMSSRFFMLFPNLVESCNLSGLICRSK